jgi:hypothetical protein
VSCLDVGAISGGGAPIPPWRGVTGGGGVTVLAFEDWIECEDALPTDGVKGLERPEV